jgi:DNA repair exonuclease SbcCD ATPase subunit
MTDEKDRLGTTLKKKERAEEERYFAEQDRERLEKLRAKKAAAEATGHTASCPRCGQPLVERDRKGVMIDVCDAGCGMWLDQGELEVLAERENDSWLSRLLDKAF